MQTTFNVAPPAGYPGMPFDDGPLEKRAFPAAEDIPFGVLCELLANGSIQRVQDAGTAGSFLPKLAGISMYAPIREQAYVGGGGAAGNGYWKKGEMVPVVRRGRVWAQFDAGGTWPEYAAVNVHHNSDGSAGAGVFTLTAVSTTSHAEIDVAPACLGIEAALAQPAYTDGFGNSIQAAVVSINLAP